jgi:tRNA-specific 2-thiouridylase
VNTGKRRAKALVAMSGGVDSSVAAATLVDRGLEVVGMSIDMFSCALPKERGCCSAADRMDAREVCEQLSIPHFVVDLKREFRDLVIDPFVAEYTRGRTPSPCVACNTLIKFPALVREAARLGADLIATGHYARVDRSAGRPRLFRALDARKDQSYFLFGLCPNEIGILEFPLGSCTKDEVRRRARELGFAVEDKAESQEICFAPGDDYAALVESRGGARLAGPGDFVDMDGRRVGRHSGVHRYTIGQRRGLGFGVGQRQYVVSIDRAANRVVLGPPEVLLKSVIEVAGISWTHPDNRRPGRAQVRIRSTHNGQDASIEPTAGDRARVVFDEPVRAAAPGQAAVFYDGDEVLGGGWIA